MRLVIALVVLGLAGCGSGQTDFTGTYEGTLDINVTCDDASVYRRTAAVKWTILNSADLVITPDVTAALDCTSLHANVAGNVATVKRITACAQFRTPDGVLVQDSVKSGGTLKLDGENLHVELGVTTNLTYPNGTKPQCSGPLSGTIIRRR